MNPRHLAMATAAVVSATVILTLLWLLNVPSLPVTAGAVTTTSTRYVSTTGTDSDDCTDSTSPCRTVQYAVDQASEGRIITVASGVYTDIHQRASITQVVYISKTVTVRGSYTIDSWTTSDPENNPTTLDAQGQGRVLYITAPEPGTGISPTIEGLHITGGDTAVVADSEWDGEPGGGVYAITATLTLSRCRVVSNTSNRFAPFGGSGGGVYLRNSRNAALIGNIIRDNGAESGGGI